MPQQDRGTRPKQNRIHEVGTDDDPHMDEVRVAAVLNQVGTGIASALNQVGAVAVPHSDQPLWLDDTITITDMKTNGTEAFANIEIPGDIGKCRLATLRCKVDTGTGSNVMPLHTFTKLFPKQFDTDGHPTGLTPSTTCLTAYNSSPIRQFGTFRTCMNWTPQGKQTTNCLHTQWYVADTPGPAILGLPTCNKLGIVELNCAVNLQQKRTMQQKTPTTADTQLKRGPHQCIPRLLWRYRMLPRYLSHHPSRGCPTSCPCSMKVPYCNAAPGAWEAGWMGEVRHHYPSWRTDGLGIISGLLHETQWETMTLLESQEPEWCNQEGPLQNPDCGRNHPPVSWQYKVHEVGWNFIIPVHCFGLRVITPHHI